MDWNATLYKRQHSFVWRQAVDLVDLLDPRPGERILDVGCGTGELTALLASRGARVVGMDKSAAMLEQARAAHPGIEFVQGDVLELDAVSEFDGILSNAVLHWVQPPRRAAEKMFQALKPGGRLTVELGGKGNCALVLEAAFRLLHQAGIRARNPWYFPSLAEYAAALEQTGFDVLYGMLFDRPIGLEGGDKGLDGWLEVFGRSMLDGQSWPPDVIERLKDILRPKLFNADKSQWTVDYRRLRMTARKPCDSAVPSASGECWRTRPDPPAQG